MQHIEELESPGRFPAYSSLQVVGIVCKSNSQTTMSYMPLFNKVMKMLALDKTIAMVPLQRQDLKNRSGKDKNARLHAKKTDKATEAVKTFVLAIKLVSVNILRLGEKSEKTEYFNILSHALQKVDAIVILEKIVANVSKWMLHTGYSKVLSEKQKEAFLVKMETLMRFKDQHNALPLLSSYFEIIFALCSRRGGSNMRSKMGHLYGAYSSFYRSNTSFISNSSSSVFGNTSSDNINVHLKAPFMAGLLSPNPIQRRSFFDLYSKQLAKGDKLSNVYSRLQAVLCQDWEPLNSRFWLPLATRCILSGRTSNSQVQLDSVLTPKLPPLSRYVDDFDAIVESKESVTVNLSKRKARYLNHKYCSLGSLRNSSLNQKPEKLFEVNVFLDEQNEFYRIMSRRVTVLSVLSPLEELSYADQRIAAELWIQVFSQSWYCLSEESKIALVRPLIAFLSQHYHRKQLKHGGGFGYRRNIVQVVMKSILKCRPMPYLPPELSEVFG